MPANIEPATFFCFMKPHHFFDIEWIYFPDTEEKVEGCYLIGHSYVGASIDIRSRVLNHLYKICDTTTGELKDGCLDTDLGCYVSYRIIKNKKIEVTFLSSDTSYEEYFYKAYGIPIHSYTRFYNQIYKDNGK